MSEKRKYLSPDELQNPYSNKLVCSMPGRAPAMVTTISPSGSVNVATFEHVMSISSRPPKMLLAISPKSDTFKNLEAGNDCVIGFPRLEYIQQAYDAGVAAPRDVSELDLIPGLTTYESKHVAPPSLNQCWVNVECKPFQFIPVGHHTLVLLDVLGMSIENDVWKDDTVERRNNLPAVYYTAGGDFFTPGKKHHFDLTENLKKYTNKD